MTETLKKEFKKLYHELKLSNHTFRRMYNYLTWCFKDIDFDNRSVLDIGGGNGIYSFYAKFNGAKQALNLEPFAAGSTQFNFDLIDSKSDFNIQVIGETIQRFDSNQKFDIIIMHDSINHLDESVFEKIHKDSNAFKEYKKLINKIVEYLSQDGTIIITDCSNRNFWGDLGLKSPFAPTINWHLHQPPSLVKILFEDHVTQVKLRWSPFKRFGVFGRLLSKIGMVPSYFMQSHFNLVLNFDSGND